MNSYINYDPVLEALVIYTKMHGRPFTAESLISGLPIEEGKHAPQLFSKTQAKSLFSRAAAKAGFKTKIMRMSLDDISSLMLPAILLLHDENNPERLRACILQRFDDTKERAKIILPELGEVENDVSMEELKEKYYGVTLFLKKDVMFDSQQSYIKTNKEGHWFWGTVRQVTSIYRDVLLASLIINFFVLATPLFTMNVYDRVIPNNSTGTLWALAIGVLVVYVVDLTLKFIRTYFLEVAGRKSDIIMSSKIFERVMDLKMENFPKSIGSFANVLKEFESVRNFMTSTTIAILIDLPFVFIFVLTVVYLGGWIGVIPIIIAIILAVYTYIMKNKLHETIKNTYASGADRNGILIESLGAMETIKTLGASGYSQWRWEEATGNIADKSIKTKFISSSFTTITGFLVQLNTVAIIVAGVYMIDEKLLTMGGLIAIVILSSRIVQPLGQVSNLLANYEHTRTAYESLDAIMNMETEHPYGKKFVMRPEFNGTIEIKNISFTYPEADKASLRNVSLKIDKGEKVAIIGKIGSGKTTVEKLVMGLYEPDEGSILIDGIDLKQIDPADLRKNVAYVGQDITLFSGTVRENIVYRAPYVDDELVLEASKISGVLDYVNKDPKGFDMSVGERGAQLSGGQRQSIAIARAILLDSPIVIMDEPTNSMDKNTEAQIIKNIKGYLEEKTALIVTHKTAILQLVDRIVVMDDGEVVADGPRDVILNKLKGQA